MILVISTARQTMKEEVVLSNDSTSGLIGGGRCISWRTENSALGMPTIDYIPLQLQVVLRFFGEFNNKNEE